MALKDKLFWEKYRPKSLKQLILLPRIDKFLKGGIKTNLIFYGNSGVGKTTLARILSKDSNVLELNTSMETSIDVLREQITDHCNTLSFQFGKDTLKIVLLDEFDRASKQYQDALKGFMEKYKDTVRFILTTNHIDKIEPELQSRFNLINFDPLTREEIDFLQNGYHRYLKAVSASEKVNIDDEGVSKIVTKTFPDLRAGVQLLQEIHIGGDTSSISNVNSSYYLDFYNFLLNKENVVSDNFFFVTENFTENPENGFKILGRPFFKYLLEMKPEIVEKNGHKIIVLSKSYNAELEQTIDPLLHLISYVCEMKTLLN